MCLQVESAAGWRKQLPRHDGRICTPHGRARGKACSRKTGAESRRRPWRTAEKIYPVFFPASTSIIIEPIPMQRRHFLATSAAAFAAQAQAPRKRVAAVVTMYTHDNRLYS